MDTVHHEGPMDRRTFLRVGSAGAAAVASGLGVARAQPATAAPVCRTLGRTGLKVNVVGLGTLKTSEPAVMQAAFDHGVNYIDTARVYMDGRNEGIVGEALKGYRDKVYVATKVKPGPPEEMRQSIQASLDALGVDYVDVLHLHGITTAEEAVNKEYRAAFDEARQQGRIRFAGVATHKNEVEVINAMVDDPDKFWDVVLLPYNFKSDPSIREVIARAGAANIGVVAMKTQARTGYDTKELGDISPHKAALKWVLQDTNVAVAIPGMVNLEHVKEDTAVMGMDLTEADLAILERYDRAITPYYCHRCDACAATCPNRVDIAEVNRSLMYAEGYGDLELARATYRAIPKAASLAVCTDCAVCTARCAHGLDLLERLRQARELLA